MEDGVTDIIFGVKKAGHLPQRMHSQESGYSPAQRILMGYSHQPKQEEPEQPQYEDWELKEKCETHEGLYNELVSRFKNNELPEDATLDRVNAEIRMMNRSFGAYGCPELPELESRPIPTFAIKPPEVQLAA